MGCEQVVSRLAASVLVLASLWDSVVDAKPDGVPQDACDSMNPAHGKAPQSYPCPFIMYPNKRVVRPNDDVVFTMEAPPGRAIRGFMVQARVDVNTVIGQFIGNTSADVKVIDCCEAKQNTASHTSADPKTKIQLTWTAPSDYLGPFTFFVTVAETHGKFWVRLEVPEKYLVIRNPDLIAA